MLLYLATGVFDKGGIARYCRFQIDALRQLFGEQNVHILSVLGPDGNALEAPFAVNFAGGGGLAARLAFVAAGLRHAAARKPKLIWCNHVRLLWFALLLRVFRRDARVVVNVYGLEVWSGRQRVYRWLLRRVDYIVAISQFTADLVRRRYGVAERRIRIIRNCVDAVVFAPGPRSEALLHRRGVPAGPPRRYVLTLGRLSEDSRYKGYERLIDAMALIEDQSVVALFAGDGDYRNALERRVRERGLADRVFFLGTIPDPDLPLLYRSADVFALVSEFGHGQGEGLGFTLIEAAACGCPTIAGDEDGSRETVVDRVTGRVISPRDGRALASAIRELLDNDLLRASMGRAARRNAEETFGVETFAALTTEIAREASRQSAPEQT